MRGLSTIDPTTVSAPALRAAAARKLSDRPKLVRDRLAFIRAHPDALDRVLRHSYWHSNGFAKIRAVRGEAFSIRLHVWEEGSDRIGDVDPHSHRWPFASWIAAGPGIQETIFQDITGSEPPSHRATTPVEYTRFDYGRDGEQAHLRSPRPATLIRLRTLHRRIGTVYGCALGTVHTVSPIGRELVATVVLQGPAVENITPVYCRSEPPSQVDEQAMTASELRSLLGEVEAAIASSAH